MNVIGKKRGLRRFKKEDVPKLRYGMLHSRFGDAEGVSIVMEQVEEVLNKYLEVPKKNILYLIGNSKKKSKRITEDEVFSIKNRANQLMLKKYHKGYGGEISEEIENAIYRAKNLISKWVKKNKIDVIIAHNSSHPVNFVGSVALSRYYRDALEKNEKVPKYILWWHDSHLERKRFSNPSKDARRYLLEGVPGKHVEHILFINSIQYEKSKKYFNLIEKKNEGFNRIIRKNHDIVYNTTDIILNNYKELKNKFNGKVEEFFSDFNVRKELRKKNLNVENTLFVLQPTRILKRKRIDFALKYCYELLQRMKNETNKKGIYFFVSGHSADNSKNKLKALNKKLAREYNENKLILVFAEDHFNETEIDFKEYPQIFAKLRGIATYFSSVEGFGNNLLEVLASGLIPVVYKYPVFKRDIEKFNFNLIAFNKYEISKKKLNETINLIKNQNNKNTSNKGDRIRDWAEKNLRILKKYFPNKTIAYKLVKAITSERNHKNNNIA